MVSKAQVAKILRILLAGKDAYKTTLRVSAEDMAESALDDLQAYLRRAYGASALISEETRADVINKLIGKYIDNLDKGGSTCIERILTKSGDGFMATTRETFVPWLNDMAKKEADDVLATITRLETEGVHPRKIATQLESVFEGTRHNALTAARTEASKIRNDAIFSTLTAQGYQYFRYVTAGDDRVRPEHAMRDGKIYRADDAPYIGEYNCRCRLVPADYEVEVDGAKVTESEAEYLTKEQAGYDD